MEVALYTDVSFAWSLAGLGHPVLRLQRLEGTLLLVAPPLALAPLQLLRQQEVAVAVALSFRGLGRGEAAKCTDSDAVCLINSIHASCSHCFGAQEVLFHVLGQLVGVAEPFLLADGALLK